MVSQAEINRVHGLIEGLAAGVSESELREFRRGLMGVLGDSEDWDEDRVEEILKHALGEQNWKRLKNDYPFYGLLVEYIQSKDFVRSDFGKDNDVDAVVAFSFGEGSEVNGKLAQILDRCEGSEIYAQWEIAELARGEVVALGSRDEGIYLSTDDVVEGFVADVGSDELLVKVVAQAWHAGRCVRSCERRDLKVIAGEFVDEFAAGDPQPWVRNSYIWMLRESIVVRRLGL